MKSRLVLSIFIILACLCPIGALASGCDTLRIRVMTYNLRLGELATLKQLAEHIIAFNPDLVALQGGVLPRTKTARILSANSPTTPECLDSMARQYPIEADTRV